MIRSGLNDDQIRRDYHVTSAVSELCPAEVLERQTRVPYFGHVGNLVAVELHYVDVIRADLSTRGRNRPTLPGMRSIENSVGGDVVPRAVRRE